MSDHQRIENLAEAARERKLYAEWDPQRLRYIVYAEGHDDGLYAAVQANGNQAFDGGTEEIALAAAAEAMGLLSTTTDQRDQGLTKPFEDMNMADVLEYMERSEKTLRQWLELRRGALGAEEIRQALQSILWGREMTEQTLRLMIADSEAEAAPDYDQDEAARFITERMMDMSLSERVRFPDELIEQGCICRRLVENILTWDEAYMEQKGIIAPDEDESTPPGPIQ